MKFLLEIFPPRPRLAKFGPWPRLICQAVDGMPDGADICALAREKYESACHLLGGSYHDHHRAMDALIEKVPTPGEDHQDM